MSECRKVDENGKDSTWTVSCSRRRLSNVCLVSCRVKAMSNASQNSRKRRIAVRFSFLSRRSRAKAKRDLDPPLPCKVRIPAIVFRQRQSSESEGFFKVDTGSLGQWDGCIAISGKHVIIIYLFSFLTMNVAFVSQPGHRGPRVLLPVKIGRLEKSICGEASGSLTPLYSIQMTIQFISCRL